MTRLQKSKNNTADKNIQETLKINFLSVSACFVFLRKKMKRNDFLFIKKQKIVFYKTKIVFTVNYYVVQNLYAHDERSFQ